MVSTLIETININADDFTDNFLTCPTCMGPYDEGEHSPKLLPCSHTLCRSCLERIALTAVPVTASHRNSSQPNQLNNAATLNASSAASLVNNSLTRSVAAADAAVAAINNSNSSTSASGATSQIIDHCFRCPICRETIVIPRAGGINGLPPSFLVNQLLDLVKNQRRDLVPRCTNHSNEELLFCETCDTAFCSICESHCRITSNADHIVIPFSIAIKRMTEIFLFKSNQCINSFNLSMGNVQREMERLNETVESVAITVNDSFNELKAVIDKRKEDTLKELAKIKESKIKILSEQMLLIANEKQRVEAECSKYNQSQIDFKFLSGQIQSLNEKLDCLRSLCEPRENSFIRFEFRKQATSRKLEESMKEFGKFKVSNTYPPLCSARIVDHNNVASLGTSSTHPVTSTLGTFASQWKSTSTSASLPTYSANLALELIIQTVDYYGQKRNEGGDPVVVKITDPQANHQVISCANNRLTDHNNGAYSCKLVPKLIGKYKIEVSIFTRFINHMPIEINIKNSIDALWTFGGSSNSTSSSSSSLTRTNLNTMLNKGLTNNKGSSDRDFNMPISVRYINQLIYVLDSGNNRIKVLSKQGNFVSHVEHGGLSEASATAMAQTYQNGVYHLFTINWRLKLLSDYQLTASESHLLKSFSFNGGGDLIQEPVNLFETFHPNLFIIEDKKRLHLCTSSGEIVFESLEKKMRSECNIKNVTAFCCSLTKRRLFVADSTAAAASTTPTAAGSGSSQSSGAFIYELDLDWLTDYKLDALMEKHIYAKFANSRSLINYANDSAPIDPLNSSVSTSSRLSMLSNDLDNSLTPIDHLNNQNKFTFRKFNSNLVRYPSNSSLASAISTTSNATTITSFSASSAMPNSASSSSTTSSPSSASLLRGTYTSICLDLVNSKLLAAKCDKTKTNIEIFNSETYNYEYSIESSLNDKPMKRVTSMCCTPDGYVICVDLVQNCVKMYRYI